ncbi:hypothetical protein EGW08_020425 [Elysia chlorotica]|uniref:C3H1-type domain-containing protein n=1 Tax=Elysia chlorotica TaxID=188477 RepID=A0A433SRD9_ELYCH|nr:hypothetical protein EGW08_020425 [Elysia chlorotica]
MKLPLAVEASVADELRTWLALELQQLNDASSTSQFAHHVVTILLHEDLDIEDEPLSSGDDFLKDIFSMRETKTREKQKRAAVEFLRSAVCNGNHADVDIQMVVEELMQKIDATKSKMQSRKPSKRSLLTPLAVNIDSPVKKIGVKTGASEQLYNEAFPSLSGEESPPKAGASLPTPNVAWSKSPGSGKENQKKRVSRRIGSRCTWLFRSAEEASACDIARETAAVVLEDLSFSAKEAMEVWAPSHMSSTPFTNPSLFCWTSAFSRANLMTKPFTPTTAPLQSLQGSMELSFTVKIIIPVIVGDRTKTARPGCPHINAISNWEEMGFCPVSHKNRKAKNQRKTHKRAPKTYMSSDMEVKFYLCHDDEIDESTSNDMVKVEVDETNFDEEIEGPISFPSHYGSYWQDLISGGAISLYPSFDSEQQEEDHNMKSSAWSHPFSNDALTPTDKFQEISDGQPSQAEIVELGEIKNCANNLHEDLNHENGEDMMKDTDADLNEIFDKYLHCWTEADCNMGADHTLLRPTTDVHLAQDNKIIGISTPIQLNPHDYECVAWDTPWHTTEWDDINQDILADLMGTKKKDGNPYLPPQLASCVKSEHSQFLQSAFVNAFFSSPQQDIYSQAWKPVSTHQRTCFLHSLYEHQFIRPKIWPVELVKGSTCSNWLENNCKLGLLCPFSHPSI